MTGIPDLKNCLIYLQLHFLIGGRGEIRTLGKLYAYGQLATAWFKPLTHSSVSICYHERICEY